SPTPTHASSTCGAPANPWGYTLCGGRLVTTPDPNFCTVFNCAPRFWTMKAGDYVAECTDGSYVPNGGRPNECAGHGTEAHRLYGPGAPPIRWCPARRPR